LPEGPFHEGGSRSDGAAAQVGQFCSIQLPSLPEKAVHGPNSQSKLHVAFEEADDCVDWLQYLKDGKLHEDAALLQEAKELAAILAAADRTARKNTARVKKVASS
jgi:hypothetical protein